MQCNLYPNNNNWSSEETRCLIGLWNNDKILRKLEQPRNRKVYDFLTQQLRKQGYNRTTKQVNKKIRDLKYSYRRSKETADSRAGKRDWEFFKELDTFLGDVSRTGCLPDNRTEDGEVGKEEDVDFICDLTAPQGSSPLVTNTLPKPNQNCSNWSSKETRFLIGLWNNDRVLRKLQQPRNKKVYNFLSRKLWEVGYNRTAKQVAKKIRDLKYSYRRSKETAGKRDWEFFEELDSFLGDVSRTDHGLDTRTEEDGDGEFGEEEDVDFIFDVTAPLVDNTPAKPKGIWSSEEVRCLIGLWNNNRILCKLEQTRNKKGYDILTQQLRENGYNRTTKQVNKKIRDLKYFYRRNKETAADSRAGKRDWEFFEELDTFLGDASRLARLRDTRTEEDEESSSTQDGVHPVHLVDNTRAMDAEMVSFASNLDVESEGDGDSFVEMEGEPDEDEGDSDSSICGLCKEVTLAVLPRLQLEELLVELRRRNVDMAGSNNRKNLVKVLHHLMVGEYAVEELQSITTGTKNVASCNVKETASTKPMVWVVQPGASGNENLMVAKNAQSLTQGRKRVTSSTRNTSGPMRAPEGSQSRNQPINTQKTKSMAAETTVHPGSASDKLKEIVDQVTRDLEGSQSNNLEGSRSSDLERSQPDTAVNAVSSSAGNASSSSNPESLNRLVKQEGNYQRKDMQEGDREKEYTDDSDNMDWDPEDDDFSSGEDTADGTAQQEASWDTGGGDANSGTAPEDMPSSSGGGSVTEGIATPQKPPKFVMTREALKNPQLYYGTRIQSKKKRGVKKKCPYCPYLGDNRTLELHIRIHTGEKPFKCSMCDYSACQKANLDRHMLKHTGEKPFMCGECGYRTAYKCHLMPHMLEHAGSKPFVCEDCGYRTIRKSNLKWHQKTHQKNRKHKHTCTLCPYTARRSVEIVKHMDYKHKDRRPDDHSPDHESAVAVSNIATVDHHSSAPSADLQQQPSSSSVQQVQVETQSNCNTAPEGSAFT
ncbi:uncharacterized protein LOC144906415 isoform X3 [Branchiostoma floridae x Branchiostoma belcheri]